MFQERIPATPIPVTTFLRLNSSNPARKEALTKHATRFINANEAGIRETLEITTCIDGAVVVDDRHESHSDKTRHITIDIYVAWCEPNDPDHLTKPVGCVHLYDTVGKNGQFQYRAFVRPRHKADMAFWIRYVLWADKKIKHYTEAKSSHQATLQVQISIVETKRTEIVTLNAEMKKNRPEIPR
ncbi:hypothetical protein EWM64_g8545 [Hericium alpestre]|uniref:Uncharacterized protein n=1 Tax=Hericium alpestre TaxID=135208 RepID=A0A4Y9ZPP0_9AGAM|nr:hypothetical protein EWM64_g8545 [Hericium alpestre]